MAQSHRMIEPFAPTQIKEVKIFLEAQPDDICETSYKDRGGKYQGQTGVTPPKV